ncbi:MAG: response regulator, partial [Phycisphaerae bacterium]|nr:response regulator [Phycisphaerae bacterium]
LRDNLTDTMHTLGLRAHSKELELAFHVRSDVPDILVGDVGRLRQVVVNLVGNALKFTEQGEVVLRVARQSQEDGKIVLQFSVSDTGIGIPQEKQKTIFEAFEQADMSTTRQYGGTGLGLAISSRLVELMGGEIWLESEPAKGTTFHFTALLGIGSEVSQVPEGREEVEIRGRRALVVDDNATNRRILEEMLGHWGLQPTVANSARAGLHAVEQSFQAGTPFDLALIDVHMPEVDGLTLVEWIREKDQMGQVTMMLLTSAKSSVHARRAEALGVAAYMAKPIKQSVLMDAISNSLRVHDHATKPEAKRRSAPAAGSGNRSLRILVAEDNRVNQMLARRILEKEGHQVTLAGNGQEAIDTLASQDFDLILMDVQMPEMDGIEAASTIRRQEGDTGRRIPIIAATAHAMKGDREACLQAGMDRYVTKPIRPDKLFQAMEELVPGVSSGKPDEATNPAGNPPAVDS